MLPPMFLYLISLCRFEAISVYVKTMALSIEQSGDKYAPLANLRANPPPKSKKPGKKPTTWLSLVDKLGADVPLFKRHVCMELLG